MRFGRNKGTKGRARGRADRQDRGSADADRGDGKVDRRGAPPGGCEARAERRSAVDRRTVVRHEEHRANEADLSACLLAEIRTVQNSAAGEVRGQALVDDPTGCHQVAPIGMRQSLLDKLLDQ